jgi:hypothetical protein
MSDKDSVTLKVSARDLLATLYTARELYKADYHYFGEIPSTIESCIAQIDKGFTLEEIKALKAELQLGKEIGAVQEIRL